MSNLFKHLQNSWEKKKEINSFLYLYSYDLRTLIS